MEAHGAAERLVGWAKKLNTPEVSVVMSVFNGAQNLEETLISVLSQDGCEFEFIVVNDGSTDGSGRILDEWARRDSRLKVIHQQNTGLTRALIRGCAEARGDFIARQDAEDLSLPGRLKEQSSFLRNHPEVVVVASGISFKAPGGEWLFNVEPQEVIEISLDINSIKAPSLVGTLFRRDAYLQVGQFRSEFSVAQDLDLWLRLIEVGVCRGLGIVHYEAKMTPGGISSCRRSEQIQAATVAIDCAKRRRSQLSELELLDAYRKVIPVKHRRTRLDHANFYYFVASCLHRNGSIAARSYYDQALKLNPFHLRALFRRLTC